MLIPALLACILAQPPAASKDTYVVETADARRIEAFLSCDVQCEDVYPREWVVFVAQAPELPGQSAVKSRMQPRAVTVNEQSPLHRPILMARLPVGSHDFGNNISIRVTYEATLRSRRLRLLRDGERSPGVPGLSAKERKAALREHGDYDFTTKPFRQWLEARALHRRAEEGEIEFALRVFREIQSYAAYEYRASMDRHASAVCRDGRSDCGGLSVLFVSTLRANGIPARALIGRWAKSAREGETIGGVGYFQAHVKAEFYAAGVGWVPVDVSQAVRRGPRRASQQYFGNDPGNFLTLHVDPDLDVDTIYFGRQRLHNLQGPAYWVTGRGSSARFKSTEDWRVQEIR
jgi:transglutaminase-like putative cysteine protease